MTDMGMPMDKLEEFADGAKLCILIGCLQVTILSWKKYQNTKNPRNLKHKSHKYCFVNSGVTFAFSHVLYDSKLSKKIFTLLSFELIS